jgi:hypothetical protein
VNFDHLLLLLMNLDFYFLGARTLVTMDYETHKTDTSGGGEGVKTGMTKKGRNVDVIDAIFFAMVAFSLLG